MDNARTLWIGLNLLDRQLLDRDGRPVGKIDDIELAMPEEPGELPTVTALLCGPAALGPRVGRRTGAFFTALRRLLRDQSDGSAASISIDLVADIGPAVKLHAERAALPVTAIEDFLDQHLIGHIPGSGAPGPDDQNQPDQ